MNKFLLVGDKFMPEMHLNCLVLLTVLVVNSKKAKKKKKIEKFMQTGNTDFIYRNELDKACFQHDMAYGKTKDLAKRTQSEKGLRDEAFKIASDPKYNGYQRGLALMVYKLKNLVEVIFIKNLVEVALLMNQMINCQMSFIN